MICHPVFELYARLCRRYPPETVEAICWIPRAQVEEAARLIWDARPVSYYAWSGHEQHANVTQTARAMSLLYALTGCFDLPGGNVLLPVPPSASITGEELPAAQQHGPDLGARRAPARTGAMEPRDDPRSLPGDPGGKTTPGTRPDRLRCEHAAGPCRRRTWTRGARGFGFLRPCRPVHEPDRRTRRCGVAGCLGLRTRGAEDRLRDQRGGTVADPVPPGRRAAARRSAPGYRHRLRSRRAARSCRAVLGWRHRCRLPPPARPDRRHA